MAGFAVFAEGERPAMEAPFPVPVSAGRLRNQETAVQVQ
jgi:hypothetical protein